MAFSLEDAAVEAFLEAEEEVQAKSKCSRQRQTWTGIRGRTEGRGKSTIFSPHFQNFQDRLFPPHEARYVQF
jgi:hypothetical protein